MCSLSRSYFLLFSGGETVSVSDVQREFPQQVTSLDLYFSKLKRHVRTRRLQECKESFCEFLGLTIACRGYKKRIENSVKRQNEENLVEEKE